MGRMSTDSLARARDVINRCRKLAIFSEVESGTCRTFLSPPMRDCHREIAAWLQPLCISPLLDSAGNFHALYPAADPDAPRLLMGSHLDTVPNAGAFDGILGVVIAVALLQSLAGRRLPFAIELLGFSDEEGVRFGVPFLGSRALIGRLDHQTLLRENAQGISIRRAIEDFGLNPEEIPRAEMKQNVLGFLEFHIEQGPLLEERGLPLGIVESIVGQTRLQFVFQGCANHAGTTPMHLRRDALAAAAEFVTAVERKAQKTSGLVATVGSLETLPGAANVIPGETRLTLDIRHASDAARMLAANKLITLASDIASRRRLAVESCALLEQPAVAMDPFLVRQIELAMRNARYEPFRLASGAGHDAMILAEKVPAAMIFLRSPGGISHHPSESVLVGDVAAALDVGMHLLETLAASPDFLKRTCRA
jgi:allantoate deiminase